MLQRHDPVADLLIVVGNLCFPGHICVDRLATNELDRAALILLKHEHANLELRAPHPGKRKVVPVAADDEVGDQATI